MFNPNADLKNSFNSGPKDHFSYNAEPGPLYYPTGTAEYSPHYTMGGQNESIRRLNRPMINQHQNSPAGLDFPVGQFIANPVVSDMAVQYGQNLMGQGKQLFDSKLDKFVTGRASKLKYYFAVDTNYVLNKYKLLFFPFNHVDWSVRYDGDEPVQPRLDLNAPDLYIPVMSFVTYVLLSGLYLGIQKRFTPDSLGVHASWAIVWLILELLVILLLFQIMSIRSKLDSLHLLALASCRYVGMIVSLLGGLFLNVFGYICLLAYSSFSLGVFLFRTLRWQIRGDSGDMSDYSTGNKKRFYILAFMTAIQPVMMWALTWQLVMYNVPNYDVPNIHGYPHQF